MRTFEQQTAAAIRNLGIITGILVLATVANIGLSVYGFNQTSAASSRALTAAHLAKDAHARLVAAQHTLAVSQKASTQTRVATVSQRCALTRLILGVLVRVHDQRDAAPFKASETECRRQLAMVKAINAATPAPSHGGSA